MRISGFLAGVTLALCLPLAYAEAPKTGTKARQISKAEAALTAANGRRSIECKSKAQCLLALPLAQRYAKERSDTATSLQATAAAQQTALALTVAVYPVPGPDAAAIISLNAQCDGLLREGEAAFFECARKVVDAYNQFRPFVEAALDQPG
jgi:hypothetical protein